MCDIEGCDEWELFSSKERRAAKEHRCIDCDRTITKGETYHYSTGLFDGNWSTHHVCGHCIAAGWWLEAVCGGWLYEHIGQETEDHWDEGYQDLIVGRLIVGHRRKWRRWDGTLMPIPTPRRIVWSDSRSTYDRHILGYEAAS